MTASADFSIPTKVLFIDHKLFVFLFIFFFNWYFQLCEFTQKVSKNEDIFTFYSSFLLFT